jgi:hypothetical protein
MGTYNTATAGVAFFVLVGLGVSACSSADDSDSASTVEVDAPAGGFDAPQVEGGDRTAADDSGEAIAESIAEQPIGAPLPTGQALATTAGVTVATSDIRTAVSDTLAAVQRNGASVFTADVNIGNERDDGSVDGSGFFVVKVPPADLEPLITDLGATVGRLSGRTQDTTDVTDQLVDLDIRIGVERDVIARFQDLLLDATEFQDIVEIERVISERTIALEQLLASQRNLDNRVDRSTLTIQLRYEAPAAEVVPADDESIDGISDAWRAGWDVFLGALFAVGFVLAVAAPFLVTAALILGVVWLATRRRLRGARHGSQPSTKVPDDGVDATAAETFTGDEQLAEPTPRA